MSSMGCSNRVMIFIFFCIGCIWHNMHAVIWLQVVSKSGNIQRLSASATGYPLHCNCIHVWKGNGRSLCPIRNREIIVEKLWIRREYSVRHPRFDVMYHERDSTIQFIVSEPSYLEQRCHLQLHLANQSALWVLSVLCPPSGWRQVQSHR